MAYQITSSNGKKQYNVNEYVIDTLDDINKIPAYAAMGSTVFVISTGALYMKNSDGNWVAI